MDLMREELQFGPMIAQMVRGPVRKPGDPGSNPGPGENFFS